MDSEYKRDAVGAMVWNGETGEHMCLEHQIELLKSLIKNYNTPLFDTLKILNDFENKLRRRGENISFWVASGAICQTIWNWQNLKNANDNISDFDIFYFENDVSYDREDWIIRELMCRLQDVPMAFDIKNQARVHLWWKDKYGYERLPYTSVYNAISSLTSTASCIGVRYNGEDINIFAPFGLGDAFSQIIRPNKNDWMKEELYELKTKKWKSKWETLKIMDWN